MTEVYMARTDALADPSVYQRLYQAAGAERQRKADAYLHKQDRRLCIASDALLRYALAEHGVAGGEWRTGEHGKPYLAGLPLRFNLSHAGEMVLCVVSDQEVGCDIEVVPSALDAMLSHAFDDLGAAPATSQNPADAASCMQIAEMFFHPEEYQALLAAPDDAARVVLFYRLWTCKESYLKCLGVGLDYALSRFCVHMEGEAVTVTEEGRAQPYSLYTNRLGSDYCYAVCTTLQPISSTFTINLH